jgi:topoisomerase-4 subunit A
MQSGTYRLIGFDISTHFDEDLIIIEKYDPRKIISAVYFEAHQSFIYLKRFQVELTEKKVSFIGDNSNSKLQQLSLDYRPRLEVIFDEKKNEKEVENLELDVEEFISVKGYKAKGKRLSNFVIKKMDWLEPLPYDPPEPDQEEKEEEEIEEGIVITEEKNDNIEVQVSESVEEEKTSTTKETIKELIEEVIEEKIEEPKKKRKPRPRIVKKNPIDPPKPKAPEEDKKPDDDEPFQMSLFD